MPEVNTNIQGTLTADEKEVFAILKDVIAKYTPSTEAYVAGGWVRDKLIGIPFNDIDILLSNMSGEDFAKLLARHLNIQDPHVIRENPEKSKNVETAKMYLPLSSGTEQELDFVRARSEVYSDESRIPEVKEATPREDSYRRDLTINALFYDIRNNQVIDFTGQGIKDLISRTIRAPGNPIDRFREDPLRVLRVIRFAAKYNGKIDPATYEAMMDPEIRAKIVRLDVPKALAKERVGEEITKMLKNPNSEYALQLLKDTGLWQDIVTQALTGTKYEGQMEALDMEQNNPHHMLNVWGHTMQVAKNFMENMPEVEEEKRVVMLLSILMHDIGKLFKEIHTENKTHPGRTSYIGHELESREISEHIMRFLKMEGNLMKQVGLLSRHHMRPHKFTEGPDGSARAMRKFVRQMGEKGLNWLDVFNLAMADAQSKGMEVDPAVTQRYRDLETQLNDAMISIQSAPDKTTVDSILNGNEIMQILNVKPGPWMSEMTEFVKDLKDENPNITKEEAAAKLKEQFQSKEVEVKVEGEDVKQASKNKGTGSVCPMHLLKAKIKEINEDFANGSFYQILSVIKELKKDYGNDENIMRLLAISMFKLLLHDGEYRDVDFLTFIFSKAEKNFFDVILCSYVLGILLLIETATEDEVIREIAERMIKMSPGTVRRIFDCLPKEINRPELKKEFEQKL